jgi:hypothetical protein
MAKKNHCPICGKLILGPHEPHPTVKIKHAASGTAFWLRPIPPKPAAPRA